MTTALSWLLIPAMLALCVVQALARVLLLPVARAHSDHLGSWVIATFNYRNVLLKKEKCPWDPLVAYEEEILKKGEPPPMSPHWADWIGEHVFFAWPPVTPKGIRERILKS